MAFGCMTTSDASVIERAADNGINFFDTARVYQGGNNERMVGAALQKYRQKVYIASKTQGKDGKTALADLDTSLKELQTDHLDVWYLHSRSTPADGERRTAGGPEQREESRQDPVCGRRASTAGTPRWFRR